MVFRKAAQMGASEYAISRALFFCLKYGRRVIYYFPTDNDVGEFARDRFSPVLQESPYLASQLGGADTLGIKQIGRGTIYFRGARSRIRMKSVPADFLIFDEVDEMDPANVALAVKRLGHSEFGWVLKLSTPTLPGYGVDAAFAESDQRHWLLKCDSCNRYWCLEDEFLERHGDPRAPRVEIDFVKGEPGYEELVCLRCGAVLDSQRGVWAAKYPDRGVHGYHVSKFISSVVSQEDRERGLHTRPAVLLDEWRRTRFPGEFWNSELGLPYLDAEGGVTEQDLLEIVGAYGQQARGRNCVMGVDQGNGLHVVIEEPHEDFWLVVRVHYEPMADESFSVLDHFMHEFDVRACVIDAMPNTHSARAFARRFPGRVWLRWFSESQKGAYSWGMDQEGTATVTVNRTECLDAWRDVLKVRPCYRRIPQDDPVIGEFRRQCTNVLRRIEDTEAGGKRAVWIKRGADHFAHAFAYAEVAAVRMQEAELRITLVGEE